MEKAVQDVVTFHTACDVPVLTSPKIPAKERQTLRWKLITEEVNVELYAAMFVSDFKTPSQKLAAIADAIGDSIYVLIGTAVEYGIPLASVWQAIQNANMAKVDPTTGKVTKRADGKVLKPEGWQPPDIEAIITKHLAS